MLSEMEFDVNYYDPAYRVGSDTKEFLSHENHNDYQKLQQKLRKKLKYLMGYAGPKFFSLSLIYTTPWNRRKDLA